MKGTHIVYKLTLQKDDT